MINTYHIVMSHCNVDKYKSAIIRRMFSLIIHSFSRSNIYRYFIFPLIPHWIVLLVKEMYPWINKVLLTTFILCLSSV